MVWEISEAAIGQICSFIEEPAQEWQYLGESRTEKKESDPFITPAFETLHPAMPEGATPSLFNYLSKSIPFNS